MKVICLIASFLLITLQSYAQVDPATDTTIFNYEYEVAPQFKGGLNKFRKQFFDDLKKSLNKNGVTGIYPKGWISFMIEKDGSVHNLNFAGDINSQGLESQILTVFKSIKGWQPARIYNKPVRATHFIEFNMSMPNGEGLETHLPVQAYPQPKAGYSALYKYITNNRNKTVKAHGWVYVTFTVGRDGGISNATAENSKNDELNKEAIRLIENSGGWIPARQSGREVRTEIDIPVSFD